MVNASLAGLDLCQVAGLLGFAKDFHVLVDAVLLIGGDLVARVDQRLLGRVQQGVGLVHDLGLLLLRGVLGGELLRVLDHALDVVLFQLGGGGDGDRLLLAGAQVLGLDVHDAVGVDVEGDLDLGDATGCRRYADQVEPAQRRVVEGHGPLALQHVDFDGRLVVGRGGEHLALPGRDGRVALDELGEHVAHGLDAQAERRHVQQQQVLDLSRQHATLDCGAHCDAFHRVDAALRVLAEELLDHLEDDRHAGRAADQDDPVDARGRKLRVGDCLPHGRVAAVNYIPDQLFELGTGEHDIEVLGAVGVGGDEREVDLRLQGAGQLDLRLLRRIP